MQEVPGSIPRTVEDNVDVLGTKVNTHKIVVTVGLIVVGGIGLILTF